MTDRHDIMATMNKTKKTARRHRKAQLPRQVALRFDDALYRALDRHADRANRTVSDLVRECCQLELPRLVKRHAQGEYRARKAAAL